LGLGMIVAVSALVGGILRLVVDRWLMRLSGARPRRRRGPVASQLDRAHAHLETQGWRIPRSLPHLEAARWVQKHTVEDAGALEDLARLYYGVRYGGDAIDGAIGPARDLADRVMRLGPPRASS